MDNRWTPYDTLNAYKKKYNEKLQINRLTVWGERPMKKTWKQWIAIACAFTMLAGILPAAVLADEEAATPTNLVAASEEIQEEPGEEIPGVEPAEEGQEEAPGDEPGEEPAEVGQTEEPGEDGEEEEPAEVEQGEDPADEDGEEPAGDGQGEEETEDEQGEEPAEDENDSQNDLPRLSFGKPGYNGTLKAGEEFRIVFVSDLSRNFLVTLTLLPGADQIPDTAGVRMTYDGISQELARIENEDPENTEIRLQFGAYAAQDTEYVITVTAPFDTYFILTADTKPAEPAQEDETDPIEGGKENENPADNGEDPEEPADGDKDEETEEPGTEIIRLWITADGAIEIGEPVKLIANADPELTGVPTWYVRNAQVEDNAWQKLGYGEYLTVETAEGNEYRFVMQDGTESEVLKLGRSEEPAEEEPAEEEPTEEEPTDETTGEEEAGETEDGDTEAGDDENGDTEEEVPENTDVEKTEEPGDQVNEETETPGNPEETEEPEKEPEVTEDTEETEKPEDGEEAEDTEKNEEETENTEETEEESNDEETDEEEKEDEDGKEEETEEEPEETEEPETQTDSEEMLALGYYGAQIVMSDGADIFESMEEDAEPVGHLEAGIELWIRSTENDAWAEIYSADEEAPARYIRWEVVMISRKPETEEVEEELLARSIEISSTLWGMKSVPLGQEITMTAELINFQEDDQCTYQWQYLDKQTNTYIDIDGANELTYVYYINTDNFYYTWRLVVIISNDE